MTATTTVAGRFVGQRIARREDLRLLTGRGSYVDDVVVPGTLHLAFVRSEVARGGILAVDVSEARKLDGVRAVYLADDLNPAVGETWTEIMGPDYPAYPPYRVLADGDVRYVGEPIVAVVAESRYVAEDACDLVGVDIEPLPAVVDVDDALAPGAPVVHPERGTNLSFVFPAADDPEIDEIFASAAHVVTETYHQHRYLCVPMETRGVLASWNPTTEELDAWASTQSVHGFRGFTARLLGIPEHRIRVVARDVGGGFGQKMFAMREEWAVLLATKLLARPVKWIEDRRENLVAGHHSREERMTISVAADAEGRLLALRAHQVENVGAYPFPGSGSTSPAVATVLPGPYRIPRVSFRADAVFTNTCGRCAYRGPWLIETVAREQVLDRLAAQMGLDPLELRRRNVIHQSELPYTTATQMVYDSISPEETLEQAAQILDYEAFRQRQAAARREGRYLGVGLSLFIEPTGGSWGVMGAEVATVRVEPSGKVFLFMGSTSQGHSVETTMAQVVADELGCDVDDVTVVQGDSTSAPYGFGTGGSRTGPIGGALAAMAAAEVRGRILALAAHAMEASPDDLEIARGVVAVRGTPSRSLTLAQVAAMAYLDNFSLPPDMAPGLEATVRFKPPLYTWANACHACEVEVDVSTGAVTITRYVVSEDCGRMINPNVVEGQIAGGVVQGIGGVLYEHMVYDADGNPTTTTFLDYLLPTAAEVPALEYGHVETPSSTPGGHRGLGEGGAIASPAAITNAVADALAPLGVRVVRTPLGPSDVLELLATAPSAPPGHAPRTAL